jgi:glycosyltransferase domain-containing protein
VDQDPRLDEELQAEEGGAATPPDERLALKPTTGSKVTFLLHTRGRPDFLLRTLSYFDRAAAGTDLRLIVLDGSDDSEWNEIARQLQQVHFRAHIDFCRATPNTPLLDRLLTGVEGIQTPYVAFAANDDFYLPGWLDEAVEVLDGDLEIGTVHGHAIFFALSQYVARAPLERYFIHPRLNPPVGWLEGETAADRIKASTKRKYGPSVVGWYALQRTSQLRPILQHAARVGLPFEYFEYWLVFYQAVLGKTRFLDRIIVARQINPNTFHPSPTLREARRWRAVLRREFLELLKDHQSLCDQAAAAVVDSYLQGVMSEIRWAATSGRIRGLLRQTASLNAFWRAIRPAPFAAELEATAYPDPRLPPIPKIDDDHPAVKLVGRWTENSL